LIKSSKTGISVVCSNVTNSNFMFWMLESGINDVKITVI
jgi:hypothetical protein